MSHKQRMIGLVVLFALLLSACQPLVASPDAMTQPSDEGMATAVNAIWREYESSLLAGDADRWIAQWAENGVQMPPDTLPRVGKAAIYEAMSGTLNQIDFTEFAIDNEDVEVNGDLAFARGSYAASLVAKSGGDPVDIEGKYMTIMRQQPDGAWKIYRDIFNSNMPPAAPPLPDVEAVTAEINALFTEYGASLGEGDADRWIQLWAEDGVQLPPGAPPNVGRGAIFASIDAVMKQIAFEDMEIHLDEVLVAGDLAIARGMYTVTYVPHDGSDPIPVDGKYTSTFQRQPDGGWKLYRDIFNSNVPPN
jgi:uncharacterized protein (TIGR02246 family)